MATQPTSSLADDYGTGAIGPHDRIAELNEIDQSISVLLSSAAEAVGLLSNSTQTQIESVPRSLSATQDKFKAAASNYFSTLSAIEVRLRRQVYALEEAGLIPAGDERDTRRGRVIGGDTAGRTGGGPLDSSWLNARADDKVEIATKQKLVEQAQDFLKNADANRDGAAKVDNDG